MSDESFSGSEGSEFGLSRAFWAVELQPGKEFTTAVPFDLHITQAVLPHTAKDNGRTVVSLTFKEEEEGEAEKAFAIASLSLERNDSQGLNIVIDENSTVSFTVHGKNPVHLSGYYVPDESGEEGFYGDEEIDSDELDSENDEEEEEKLNASIQAQLAAKRKQTVQNGSDAKKAKVDVEQPKKQQPQQKEQKGQQQQQQPKKQQQQQQPAKSPATKEIEGGLKYVVLKEGSGVQATRGRRVSVKYVGRLTKNNKIFDSSTKPFTFTLGTGEVISGWDKGVAGMKVGEKRTLIIPAHLGYGAKGAGKDIPPNSSLTFDVELLHVK